MTQYEKDGVRLDKEFAAREHGENVLHFRVTAWDFRTMRKDDIKAPNGIYSVTDYWRYVISRIRAFMVGVKGYKRSNKY